MASVALSIVGTAIGGPLGGMLGGMIGGMIDNVLFPAKANPPPNITTSTYGNAIVRIYGPLTRPGCNMLRTTGWRKQKNKASKLAALKGAPPAYETDLDFGVAAGPIEPDWIMKLIANGNVIFDSTVAMTRPTPDANGVVTWTKDHETHKDFDTLVVYPGNFSQLPDPTMEAHFGVGNVCGYVGTAHFVITSLNGTPYGNSVPMLQIIARAHAVISLGQVVGDVVTRCGLDLNTVSTSSLTRLIRGYMIDGQTDGVTALQPLALCYDFDLAEVAGNLRFTPRGQPPVATIETMRLAGHSPGAPRPSFQWPREPELNMPRVASITFIDQDRDCQANTQSDTRDTGSAQSKLTTNVKVTLTSDEGRKIAARMLWEANIGRQTLTAAADDRLGWIESARTFAVEVPFGYEVIRLTKRTRGANGVIEFEAKRDASSIYAAAAPGASAGIADNGVGLGGPVNPPYFIEPPSDFPGFTTATLLIAISGGDGTTASTSWSGCNVYWSTDDVTGDYQLAGFQVGAACMGKLNATLVSHGGGNPDTDPTHILSVDTSMSNGEPQAISSTDAEDAQIPYYVGGEYISAQTVSAIGANVFHLTNLWRHLYGTDGNSHAAGAAFVRLDSSVFAFPRDAIYNGRTLYFRFVSAGENLATATTYSHTFDGTGFGTGGGGLPAPAAGPTVIGAIQSIQATITANSVRDNVSGYNIYAAPGLGQPFSSAVLVAKNVSSQTIDVPGLAPASDYTIFTTALNKIGEGAPSAGVNVTTAAGQIGSPFVVVTASEALTAGQVVSLWNSSGGKVRKADNSDDSKQADGFVLANVLSGAAATVYLPGAVNAALSGLTPGALYFLDTAGGVTVTPTTAGGTWLQEVGRAADATHLVFNPKTGELL